MKKLIFLIVLSWTNYLLSAQDLTAIDNNGSIFARITYLGDTLEKSTRTLNYSVKIETEVEVKNYEILIFDLEKKKKVSNIKFNVKEKNHPDTLVLAPNGQCFFLRFSNHYYIFNSFSGRLLGDFYYPSNRRLYYLKQKKHVSVDEILKQQVITFPYHDNTFLVRHESMLVYYDAFTGIPLDTCTGFSRNAKFSKLFFTSDDKFLIASDNRKRFYIWKVGSRTIFKRLFADQFAIDQYLNRLYVLRVYEKNFRLSIFSLYDGQEINTLRKSFITKKYPPPEKEDKRIFVYYPEKKIIPRHVSISPQGKYLLVSFDYDRLSDFYMILDNATFSLISYFDELKLNRRSHLCQWISDNKLQITESENVSRIYTIPVKNPPYLINNKINVSELDIPFGLSVRKLQRNSVLSPEKCYKAIPIKENNSNSTLIMNLPDKNHSAVMLDKFVFAGFTRFGQSVVLIGPGDIPVRIKMSEIFKHGNISPEYLENFDQKVNSVTEKWLKNDTKAPAGYVYHRMDTIVPVYEMLPDETLHIEQKSITVEDSTVILQVHLLDNSGRYYKGASAEGVRDIWCGLFLRKPDSTLEKIENFDLFEYSDETREKYAIALIMDHSGSLGMERSIEMQKGAKAFISMKNPDDALAIIKYDHFVGVESLLTRNKKDLLDSLHINGINGYGGNTALLEAINTGISLLKNNLNYDRKAVVIMTDGMENSSHISKNELLKRALENNISIYTIGFGNLVDDEYLEALSGITGGSYYRIFSTRDLLWIFKDIYRRINNYYEIRFDISTIGIHQVILKICYENAVPLVTEFGNTPLPPLVTLDTADYDIKKTIKEIVFDSIMLDEPDFENLFVDLPPLPVDRIYINKPPAEDSLIINSEFEYIEFPNIRFEFDKTNIIPGTDKGLENIISFLNKYPQTQIEVIGHTDSIGSNAYNIGLSIRRAKKVKKMLQESGIDPDRIYISGRGEEQPALANDNYWRRTYNRRVEFRLILPENKNKH